MISSIAQAVSQSQNLMRQPQVINTTAGPALSVGDRAKVGAKALALVCSQRCAPDIILKTQDFARFVRLSSRTIVSGFHSPIEKDSLSILLRGRNPIIIVQGRRLSRTKLPAEWKKAIDAGRLLVVSPFTDKEKRVTTRLAEERNRFVAALADEVLIAYAHPGGKTEKLAAELLNSGKRVYTFESPANTKLVEWGAVPIQPDYFAPKQAGKAQSSA
jgi:predicted Rossmann fold nucleotide-binding protein DprA/Smf involved in DNA uptake